MNVTFVHPLILALSVTCNRPTEQAWSGAFDTISGPGGAQAKLQAAGYNLLIACASEPSEAELKRIIEDDWPGLPEEVFAPLSHLAGALVFEGEDVNAWRFDLAATVAAAEQMQGMQPAITYAPDESGEPGAAIAGTLDVHEVVEAVARMAEFVRKHQANLDALVASGLTIEACKDLLARFNRPGQLRAIRTRDFGVIIVRRPRFTTESLRFSQDSVSCGVYEACKRLALACTEFPVNGAISPRFTDSPALATSIGNEARLLVGAGIGGEVKKG